MQLLPLAGTAEVPKCMPDLNNAMQQLSSLLRNSDFLIGLVLVGMFVGYGYHQVLPLEPQGVHHWRQADCASMAWNYYEHDLNFFTPSIHNQVLNDGYTAGEFPILYYISGMLMRVLGPAPWIARLINILILFAGIWAFSRTIRMVLKDTFWAVVVPALLFTSPVLVYYGSTAMPEGPSIGLVLLGWYFFFRFCIEQQDRWIFWAIGLMGLAMSLKLSMGISFVAVLAIYVIEISGWGKFGEGKRLFSSKPTRYAIWFFGVVAIVAAWYIYADGYNTAHQVRYFLTGIRPISRVSPEEFSFVMQRFFGLNAEFAWFFPMHFLMIFLIFFNFSAIGRRYPLLFALSLLTFMGVWAYTLLFFKLFNVHDYYLVAMLVFPVMAMMQGILVLKHAYPQVESSQFFRVLVIGLLLASAFHAKGLMGHRYNEEMRDDINNPSMFDPELEDFLVSSGVEPADKVISLPDDSPNASLYLLNRKGWSGYNVRQLKKDIEFYRKRGASFLVIHDPKMLKSPQLQHILPDSAGSWNDIHVFRLKGGESE